MAAPQIQLPPVGARRFFLSPAAERGRSRKGEQMFSGLASWVPLRLPLVRSCRLSDGRDAGAVSAPPRPALKALEETEVRRPE
jgi:hypothetical protein